MATALTIGVDAVEGGGRDDGHFALAQRTLDGQMLPAARVHLNKMAAALATALGFGLWAPSSPWPCTTDIASLAGAGRCRRSCRRRRTWPTRAGCPPATGGASTPGRGGGAHGKGSGHEGGRRRRDLACRVRLTPSSSSTMSLPMDASVVHLQLLVARTAQRL